MGFKKINRNFSFADVVLESSKKNNRSIEKMEHLKKSINWNRVENVLMSHYTVGTSNEGADAYPPLLLFKCLLLQKWFHIDSDPELENMINDRWSFKTFLNFPLSKPSPDHSTFSRFRKRLSKEAMDQINSEILRHFENQGLTINCCSFHLRFQKQIDKIIKLAIRRDFQRSQKVRIIVLFNFMSFS